MLYRDGLPQCGTIKDYRIESTTTLSSGQTYVSRTEDTINFIRVVGSVFADNANGSLHIDQSIDSSNWDIRYSFDVPSNVGRSFNINITNRFLRVRYINNENQQSSFRLSATLYSV